MPNIEQKIRPNNSQSDITPANCLRISFFSARRSHTPDRRFPGLFIFTVPKLTRQLAAQKNVESAAEESD
jgi:predicted nucleic acid binding AN1-type Zn finger protein